MEHGQKYFFDNVCARQMSRWKVLWLTRCLLQNISTVLYIDCSYLLDATNERLKLYSNMSHSCQPKIAVGQNENHIFYLD